MKFEEIYIATYPLVYRRVSRFVQFSEIEETVQDVFLKVAQSIHTFDERASISSWVYKVTTNFCLNKIRDRKRQEELLEKWSGDLGPVDIGASAEDRIFLKQIWDVLDEELLVVGFYFYVDGMTQKEISELLDVSERTIRNRLQNLRKAGKRLEGKL